MAGRSALDGQVVHIHDLTSDPEYTLSETVTLGKYRTSLGVPLLRDGVAVGAISFERGRVQPFTDRQIELVRTFADQAVIALENARLLGELQARTRDLEESLEYQTATSDVLKVISRSASDVQPVLDTVVETAARLCESDSASITIREGEIYRWVSSSFSAPEPELWAALRQRTMVPGRDSLAARVALEGRVVHVADILADPDYAVAETVAAGRRTSLGVPLLREGAVLGTINLTRKRVQPYTERQIELVRTFADQAVIAIENARLLGELQARTRDLEESLEYQTATSNVLKVIARSTTDVQPVLDTLLEAASRLSSSDSGGVWMREGEVYRYISGYAADVSAADTEYWARVRQRTLAPGRNSVTGRVALEGGVVHIEDVLAIPDYAVPESVASGRRTALGVPLLRDSEVIGVISLTRKRVEPYTERQIELVRTFADQALIAIENARLLGEIRQRQAELRVTFDNMGDGVAMFDAEQRLAAWNRNFQQLLDLPDTLLAERPSLGDYIRHLATHGEYGEVDVEAEVRRLIEAAGRQYSTERARPDGRVIEVRANPVPGGGVVINYSDITERKRAEAEIHAARDAAETALHELEAAQADLARARDVAEEATQAKSMFLANMSHAG